MYSPSFDKFKIEYINITIVTNNFFSAKICILLQYQVMKPLDGQFKITYCELGNVNEITFVFILLYTIVQSLQKQL